MQMTPNEAADWAHLPTPVIFNHHEPLVVNESTIRRVDLNPIRSTPRAALNEERVLILTPPQRRLPHHSLLSLDAIFNALSDSIQEL